MRSRSFFKSGRKSRRSSAASQRSSMAGRARCIRFECLEARRLLSTDPVLSIPSNLDALPGGVVAVPVQVNLLTDNVGDTGISAAHLAVNYDPTVFTVASSDVFPGTTLVSAGSLFSVSTTVGTGAQLGQLYITLASTSQTVISSAGAAGDSLVNIDFHVQGIVATGSTPVTLAASNSFGATSLIAADGTSYATVPADDVSGSVNVLSASTSLGSWTALTNAPSPNNGIGTMLLLTDGTVMADVGQDSDGPQWYRLAPDTSGNYSDGNWTELANSNVGRLFFGSAVLPSGKVLVTGGEDTNNSGGDSNTAELGDHAIRSDAGQPCRRWSTRIIG